jgi:DNA processing protein
MNYTENAINVLTVKTFKGIGRAWIVKNLQISKSIDDIVHLLNKNSKEGIFVTIEEFESRKISIKEKMKQLESFADGVVAIGDNNFPAHRGNVKNSEQPVYLFYKGNLDLLKATNKNIAVIGLLNPDKETEIMERDVVSILVKNGVTIVSGLALGCDTIAHKQALESNGKTIAILPSSLSNILPSENKKLAIEIIENDGLLVTEYYEDIKSKIELNGRYQERDRLQALFSDSIILSASYAKNDQGNDSGSRLAMEYALSYSIPRAVMYDEIYSNNQKYDLNRQLIKEQKDIFIINKNNLQSIMNIVNLNNLIEKNIPIAMGLFD